MKNRNTLPLRLALAGNALFSTLTACLLMFAPSTVGNALGAQNTLLFRLIAIGLFLFAIDLTHQATRSRMQSWRALVSSAADMLWVLGTAVFLGWNPGVVGPQGQTLLVGVAGIVAFFGCAQFWAAGEAHRLEGTRLYRHCVAVRIPVPAEALWRAVSDLSGIQRYFPSLSRSFLREGGVPGVGAVRQCEDLKGKKWAEECTRFEEGKALEMTFLCHEPGFPYPASAMKGGWELLPTGNGTCEVQVWWELQPSPSWLSSLIMPLLGLRADLDFPPLIYRMAGLEDGNQSSGSALRQLLRPRPAC